MLAQTVKEATMPNMAEAVAAVRQLQMRPMKVAQAEVLYLVLAAVVQERGRENQAVMAASGGLTLMPMI